MAGLPRCSQAGKKARTREGNSCVCSVQAVFLSGLRIYKRNIDLDSVPCMKTSCSQLTHYIHTRVGAPELV